MELNSQLYAPEALPSEKQPPESLRRSLGGGASEPFWTKRSDYSRSCRDATSGLSVIRLHNRAYCFFRSDHEPQHCATEHCRCTNIKILTCRVLLPMINCVCDAGCRTLKGSRKERGSCAVAYRHHFTPFTVGPCIECRSERRLSWPELSWFYSIPN